MALHEVFDSEGQVVESWDDSDTSVDDNSTDASLAQLVADLKSVTTTSAKVNALQRYFESLAAEQ